VHYHPLAKKAEHQKKTNPRKESRKTTKEEEIEQKDKKKGNRAKGM